MNKQTLIFSCSVLLVSLANGQTPAVCRSGMVSCAPNAACAGGSPAGECVCNSGFTGDGRIMCRNNTRCVCAARGDPMVTLTDPSPTPQTVTENLPCSIDLMRGMAIFNNSMFCIIQSIRAHMEIRPPGPNKPPIPTMVSRIEVIGVTESNSINFSMDVNGVTPASPSGVTVATANGFQTATLTPPACNGMQIIFNATYGSVGIDIPRPPPLNIVSPYGFCGNCNGNTEGESVPNNATSLNIHLLNSLSILQSGTYANECLSLRSAYSNCANDPVKQAAAAYCTSPVTNSAFGNCLKGTGRTDVQLMNIVTNCVLLACNIGASLVCPYMGTQTSGTPCQAPTPCPP